MCKIFQNFKNEITDYCVANGINPEKVFSSAKSFNNDFVAVQHYDPNKPTDGLGLLKDHIPAPVTLIIRRVGDRVTFEQTENTQKYLV